MGIVDRLGYLYCWACAERLGKSGSPVFGLPHSAEECESCKRCLALPGDSRS